MTRFDTQVQVAKVDAKLGLLFGYGIVCSEHGEPYFDTQGDHIPPEALLQATHDFMRDYRVMKDMHTGEVQGQILFSFPFVEDVAKALGLESKTEKYGWIVGAKPTAKVFEEYLKGKRTGFSIGGSRGEDEDVDDDDEGDEGDDEAEGGVNYDAAEPKKTPKKRADDVVGKRADDAARKARRRIMRSFKIKELSTVDLPAQEGATIGIVKRALAIVADEIVKAAWMTDDVDGHAHSIADVDYDGTMLDGGNTSYALADGAEREHSHPWIRRADGSILVGASAGHTHSIVSKRAIAPSHGRNDMTTTDLAKQNADLTAQVGTLTKQLARAEAFGLLTDAERVHYARLDERDREAFLAKSAAGRAADLKAAEDADPVEYTTRGGIQLRKSQGAITIHLARENDRMAELIEKQQREQLDQLYVKRADSEVAHYPGTTAERAEMLRAIDGIEKPEIREAVHKALAAGEAALSEAFHKSGAGGTPPGGGTGATPTSPSDKLDALVAQHIGKNAGVAYEDAYMAVLDTPEGQKLYAEIHAEMRARAAR